MRYPSHPTTAPTHFSASNEEALSDEETFSDIDDEELNGLVLSTEESAKKRAIWNHMNKDYLEEKALKEKKQAEESKAGGVGGDGKRKNKRPYKKISGQQSAEGALNSAVAQRKISKKINYDALKVRGAVT